ncbi:MAG: regulatory protein RecX [Candidatus Porifericomitaceae bacterium WSBS_2022_MAG_OTU9]
MSIAMAMLGRRELCSGELCFKLRARKFTKDIIDATLHKLQQRDLQSDHRCAEVLLREHTLRGHGSVRIRQDLAQRGIDAAIIDQALIDGDCDFTALAQKVLQKRYGDNAPADYTDRAKRIAFLQRRGFTISDCRAATDG